MENWLYFKKVKLEIFIETYPKMVNPLLLLNPLHKKWTSWKMVFPLKPQFSLLLVVWD